MRTLPIRNLFQSVSQSINCKQQVLWGNPRGGISKSSRLLGGVKMMSNDIITRIGTEDDPRMSKIVKHRGVVYTSGQTDTEANDSEWKLLLDFFFFIFWTRVGRIRIFYRLLLVFAHQPLLLTLFFFIFSFFLRCNHPVRTHAHEHSYRSNQECAVQNRRSVATGRNR